MTSNPDRASDTPAPESISLEPLPEEETKVPAEGETNALRSGWTWLFMLLLVATPLWIVHTLLCVRHSRTFSGLSRRSSAKTFSRNRLGLTRANSLNHRRSVRCVRASAFQIVDWRGGQDQAPGSSRGLATHGQRGVSSDTG